MKASLGIRYKWNRVDTSLHKSQKSALDKARRIIKARGSDIKWVAVSTTKRNLSIRNFGGVWKDPSHPKVFTYRPRG